MTVISGIFLMGGFLVKLYFLLLFFKEFIYLFMRDIQKERERQRHRQREKQAPCREPNVGLNPRTLGWCPEPKVDAQPLSHPGVFPLPSSVQSLSACELNDKVQINKRKSLFLWEFTKEVAPGSLGGAAVWRLPLARDAILETRDRIPRWAPCMEPASPSACVSASLSLSVWLSWINK